MDNCRAPRPVLEQLRWESTTREQRFWSFVKVRGDCWEWTGYCKASGHGQFDGAAAHRFGYLLATGEDPGGRAVRHRCDNPPCVRGDHLMLGQHADNMRDMAERGRAFRPRKITPEQEAEIVQRYRDGMTARQAAALYGISQQHGARLVKAARATRSSQKVTSDEVDELRRRWLAGESQYALAREYGLSGGYVSTLVRGLDRPAPGYGRRPARPPIERKVTSGMLREMRDLLDRGVPQAEIARRFGVAPSYISHLKSGRYGRSVGA